MALQPFGQEIFGPIVEEFTDSLNQIFGLNNANGSSQPKGGFGIYNSEHYGTLASSNLFANWVGNARGPAVRYGFAVMHLEDIEGHKDPTFTVDGIAQRATRIDNPTYFLDIPPQAITQKENFATDITATRKGIIIETEGVVFKDIIIEGTTGVFPGPRGNANNRIPNANITGAPQPPRGVDLQTGRSTAPGVSKVSGFEEFLSLRQFFLAYASKKVRLDGDLFMIFINEKDSQSLIVEPLDFVMKRSKERPMEYMYSIKLKAVNSLENAAIFQGAERGDDNDLSLLEQAVNVAENVSATIETGRAAINASTQLLTSLAQSLDQIINNPLRQIQFAMEDLRDGRNTVLALPEILIRNTNDAILSIREDTAALFGASTVASLPTVKPLPGMGIAEVDASRTANATNFSTTRAVQERINEDRRIPLQRTFLENGREEVAELSNKLADFVNFSDDAFNEIVGRTATTTSPITRVVTDEEIILLGQLNDIQVAINNSLATNVMFQADADVEFERNRLIFDNPNIPEEQRLDITRPRSVREVTIMQNDILERIAQRELGDASRWVELVVLNDLTAPFISEAGGSGVLRPGDKILVGVD